MRSDGFGGATPDQVTTEASPSRAVDGEANYVVLPDESAVLVSVRSNVGPIDFGTTAISGWLRSRCVEGAFVPRPQPQAELTVDLRCLRSGNLLYDAELARRLDVRRHPFGEIVLRETTRLSTSGRYSVRGQVTLHGVTRTIGGSVCADLTDGGACAVWGEQVFDIRDFEISTPSALMLRIFPDVRVYLQVQMRQESDASDSP